MSEEGVYISNGCTLTLDTFADKWILQRCELLTKILSRPGRRRDAESGQCSGSLWGDALRTKESPHEAGYAAYAAA